MLCLCRTRETPGRDFAVIMYTTSWAMVGRWEFERERPADPPPDRVLRRRDYLRRAGR